MTILQKVDLQELYHLNTEPFEQNHAGIELALKVEDIASFDKDPDDLSISSMIHDKKITIESLHAPFADLSLSSKDPFIRDHSLKILLISLNFARTFGIPRMVFHTGFHPMIPLKKKNDAYQFFKQAFNVLFQESRKARVQLLVENTYEKDFSYFEQLFSDFPELRMVLDVGHCFCFSSASASDWIAKFKNQISALHLHDNLTHEDDHFSLGKGKIPFQEILPSISEKMLLTLETPLEALSENILFLKNLITKSIKD